MSPGWSSRRELNPRPLPYQGRTLPLSHESNTRENNGAGEEIRTLDIHLGRVALYQLSYARKKTLNKMVAWDRFELSKADAGRFTVCSLWPLGNHANLMELLTGIEPATYGLQNRCSTN